MPNIAIPDEYAAFPPAYGDNLAPQLNAALHGLANACYKFSKLTVREFEAARVRISFINGCQICKQFRPVQDLPGYFESMGEDASTAVHTHGPAPDEAFYNSVLEWRTSPIYSDREKLAIEFGERFCLEPDAMGYDEAFWARARTLYSDAEIYDLTVCVAGFVGAGRVVHVLGFDSACMVGSPPQMAHAAE